MCNYVAYNRFINFVFSERERALYVNPRPSVVCNVCAPLNELERRKGRYIWLFHWIW